MIPTGENVQQQQLCCGVVKQEKSPCATVSIEQKHHQQSLKLFKACVPLSKFDDFEVRL